MKRLFEASVAVLGILLPAAAVLAAPAAMTRDEIIDLAQSGVGYSYWWGHDQWRLDGANPGSCSGSCPDCTHSGSYGADCSGFAAKVWQVPGPVDLGTYSHPYSTREFRYQSTHWDHIDRSGAERGDAMVYRNDANTGGHIVVYESGDPWGSVWTYEARGCSYGIVHNLRSLSSSYVAIRRHNLSEMPVGGVLQGVVFQDNGAGTGDMGVRIPGAQVSISGGGTTIAREGDAYWSFSLPAGDYTITASAAGFQPTTRSCTVTDGGDAWCSMGLVETCVPDCSGRQCGVDPVCGEGCGSCTGAEVCTPAGLCQCQPDCTGRQCGADPVCGQSCGDCPANHACNDGGQCECIPDCSGRTCGPDPNCGFDCGSCLPGQACTPDGQCQGEGCQPDCAGRECGPDPACGLSCGMCSQTKACDLAGQCLPIDDTRGKLFGYVVKLEKNETDPSLHQGRPVGHARITFDTGETILADEHGYYDLLLPPGEYILTASVDGCGDGEATCEVKAGEATECFVPVHEPGDEPDDEEIVIRGGCSTSPVSRPALAPLVLILGMVLGRKRPGCRSRGRDGAHDDVTAA